jgi:hypothetical protein
MKALRIGVCSVAIGVAACGARSSPPTSAAAAASASAVSAPSGPQPSIADVTRRFQLEAYSDEASRRWHWRDGEGCMATLDERDAIARVASTDPKSSVAIDRALCMMLVGRCEAGKDLLRKIPTRPAVMGDDWIDSMVAQHCTGTLAPYDAVLVAERAMLNGSHTSASCTAAVETLLRNRAVRPRDPSRYSQFRVPIDYLELALPTCFMMAGDCDGGWRAFQKIAATKPGEPWPARQEDWRKAFEEHAFACKAGQTPVVAEVAPPTPPREPVPQLSDADVVRIYQADVHLVAAQSLIVRHDGAACVAELDEHDRIEPRPSARSTDVRSTSAFVRSYCLMEAGRCDEGKDLEATYIIEHSWPPSTAHAARTADTSARARCRPVTSRPLPPLVPTMALTPADVRAIAQAEALDASAGERFSAHDGSGCVAALDARDAVEPRLYARSTDPRAHDAQLRGLCMMRAGRCQKGKALLRAMAAEQSLEPSQDDRNIDDEVATFCTGDLEPRDELLVARKQLETAKTSALCSAAYDTIVRVRPSVTPRDANDYAVRSLDAFLNQTGTTCFVRAGDCAQAFRVFSTTLPLAFPTRPGARAPDIRVVFDMRFRECRGQG